MGDDAGQTGDRGLAAAASSGRTRTTPSETRQSPVGNLHWTTISPSKRPERNRIAWCLDRRNAVLPVASGFAAHKIERARLGIQRVTLPPRSLLASKSKLAR